MHDLTEGGLSAGLYEMAEASGLALRVDTRAALWFGPGKAICEALGADPWGMLGSGAFLAAFPPERVEDARRALEAAGHPTALIATAEPGSGVHTKDGAALPRYEQDEVSRILAGARG
jgi:hydrogenase expression/formation protein HypE